MFVVAAPPRARAPLAPHARHTDGDLFGSARGLSRVPPWVVSAEPTASPNVERISTDAFRIVVSSSPLERMFF